MGCFLYTICRKVARGIFMLLGPVHVLNAGRGGCRGAFLLASNHISHFDPPFLSVVTRRPVDWMAMAELFRGRGVSAFLRGVGAFPTDRSQADRASVRAALQRLKAGRVVGIFPEGGIRAGVTSLLEGAPFRPGAATLSQLAGVPIVPCVILGTDRLYNPRCWLPFRRARFWAAFGEPLSARADLPRVEARDQLERDLAAAFETLYRELRERYSLRPEDLPQTPQERMGEGR